MRSLYTAFLPVAFGLTASCGGVIDPDPVQSEELTVLGRGTVNDRYTAELWVHGNTAYTTTWNTRTVSGVAGRGNAIKIWDVSATAPVLVDSVIVDSVATIGDVQVTSDGRYMVVATEFAPGSIIVYDVASPRRPVQISRFTNSDTNPGVHTAEVQPVNGRLYAFLSLDRASGGQGRLAIVDITDPASPVMVLSQVMGNPVVHDVFVKDGILMTALWNDGVAIWDIGGGGKGGTVAAPVQMGSVRTKNGRAHNIFWYHDPVSGSKRYAFVGEEGFGGLPSASSGDLHVLDVSDLTNPREVAFLRVPGAGPHNFSADEGRGILYAAFYNGGVRAIDIRGDVGNCTQSQKVADGRCDLTLMNRELGKGPNPPVYVWGVHYTDGRLYASDMLSGLLRLSTLPVS